MKISELERNDSVNAVVERLNKGTAYLSLKNVDDFETEHPLVLLHDVNRMSVGEELMVTITKISEDRGYIRTELDSVVRSYDMIAA